MVDPTEFLDACQLNGVDFFAGVPDSLLQPLCDRLLAGYPKERHVISANEGSAVALAAGHYLATGSLGCVYMQNSGLGNAINPLTSLVDADVYGIPMLLLVGWRGEVLAGTQLHDEPQHVKQGRITQQLLSCLEIPFVVLDADTRDVAEIVRHAAVQARTEGKPVALLARKDTFGAGTAGSSNHHHRLTREQALKTLIASLPRDAVVVSTTGKVSREMFEISMTEPQAPAREFLSVGAMGHALQIAAGIALARPEKMVVCVDGDGALIMHMGGLTTSATVPNLLHVLMNNGTHESVGGQPTKGLEIDMPAIARACGYGSAETATDAEQLDGAVRRANGGRSAFIEVRVCSASRPNLGRPVRSPKSAKQSFMQFLQVPNLPSG
jgi:phosphonopyruvate decarboxylase